MGFSLFRRTGSRTANPTAQGVSLRGLGASGASRALVLADGIPLNDPFGGWVYWARQPRLGVERLEVLRGGAADLYGSGALGGVVQLVSRPAGEGRGARGRALGRRGGDVRGDAHGARLARRVGGSALGRGLHDGRLRSGRGGEPGRRGQPRPPRATSPWTPSSSGAASATAASSSGRRRYDEDRDNGTPLQTNDTRIALGALGLDWGSAARGRTSVRAWAETQLFHQTFSAVAADRSREDLTRQQRVPADALGLSAQWTRAARRAPAPARSEARRVGCPGPPKRWSSRGALRAARWTPAATRREAPSSSRTRSRPTRGCSSRPRCALDAWSQRGGRSIATPLATGVPVTTTHPDRDETAWSPRLGLLFRARPGLSLTASGYGAFRAPTLNELYRSFRVGDSLTLANPALAPERLWGGEAGALVTRGPHTLRLTAFSAEVQDAIANVTVATAPGLVTRERQNVGRTRSRGLEAELDLRLGGRTVLTRGIRAHGRARPELPGRPALEGRRLPQVPRHQATFQARYEGRLRLGLQARVASTAYEDDRNDLELDPALQVDLFAGYAVGRSVVLFAAAENVFDAEIVAARTPVAEPGGAAAAAGGGQGLAGEPDHKRTTDNGARRD